MCARMSFCAMGDAGGIGMEKDKAEGRGNCFCESYKMFFGQCFEGLERVAAGICERGC